MKSIVELPSEFGLIVIECEEAEPDDGRLANRMKDAVQAVAANFESAFDPVVAAARAMAAKLVSPLIHADAVELEFGAKFNSKVGFIVAGADGEASVRVKLTWNCAKPSGNLASSPASVAAK
jgi:hypothetical protein